MNTQLSLFEQSIMPQITITPASSCKIIQFPGTFDSDLLNYAEDGTYIGPPPDGYVWSSKFKADGTRKIVHKNSYRGEEKKAYPIIDIDQLRSMTSWLYDNKGKKYVLAFVLGINLGLRANELLSLRKHDLFLKDGTIRYIENVMDTSDHIRVYQKKTRNSTSSMYRNVFLNTACVDVLNWYFPLNCSRLYGDADIESDRKAIYTDHCRGGKDFLFPSPQKEGECLSVDMLRKVLGEAAKACGLPQHVSTHTLRKTFALTASLTKTMNGVDIDVAKAQRLLGHSDGTTTLRYLSTDQMNSKADYHANVLNVTSHLF